MPELSSIFIVTDLKTLKEEQVEVSGAGEETIQHLRKQYGRRIKIILHGFNIDGKFKPLIIKSYRW